VMPYASGIIFALVISEVLVTIGQRRGAVIGLAAAVCTAGGLGWAVWISSGRGVAPVPTGAWLAIAVGVIVALGRGGFKGGARSTARTPDSP
jgi:hypothetical protein